MESFNAVVVDDDSSISLLMTEILKQEGFDVHTFTKADEALQSIGQMNVDLIFVDYLLPGTRGDHFILKLREQDIQTPVILMTGLSKDEVNKNSVAECEGILEKPFSLEAVNKVVSQLLQKN
ncbi:response regulator [Alkalibacillus aidingensis]|uniref:response regulator n=1 Tax=Alkalibacillus aidingensis TaxID=2747607 RepID=UPI001660B806|nr:response regulator [Alkalibacillus aidingensis]